MSYIENVALRFDRLSNKLYAYTGSREVAVDNGAVDIRDFIVDDGVTDNATNINAAIEASAVGSVIDFRHVAYPIVVSSPVYLIEQRNYLFNNVAGAWPYNVDAPYVGAITAAEGFTGSGIVILRENSISGRSAEMNAAIVHGLCVDGTDITSGNIDCVRVEGLVRDIRFEYCTAIKPNGSGRAWQMLQGTGTLPPRGIRMKSCVAWASANHGFRFNGQTDCYLEDLLAVACTEDGFYFTNSGENIIVGCRSVFNNGRGFYLDGTAGVAGTTFIGCTTDRNDKDGFRVVQEGDHGITFVGCIARRDGAVTTSTDYAGFQFVGTSGHLVAPVDLVGCLVMPGVDDGGSGDPSPEHAIRSTYASKVSITGGDYHGITASITDATNNSVIEYTPQTVLATGAVGAKTRVYPSMVSPSEPFNGRTFADVGTPEAGDLMLLLDVSDGNKLKVAQYVNVNV